MENLKLLKILLNEILINDDKSTVSDNNSKSILSSDICDLKIGDNYFFRTVTYAWLGKFDGLVKIEDSVFIKLTNASWVADTGRFHEFVRDGKIEDYEKTDVNYIAVHSLTDFFKWKHELPTGQNNDIR